eukprot:2613412-Ditylum_brightwellii.AAC.1
MVCGTPRKKSSSNNNRVFSPSARVVSPPSTNKKGEITTWSSTSTNGLQLRNILKGPPQDSFFWPCRSWQSILFTLGSMPPRH